MKRTITVLLTCLLLGACAQKEALKPFAFDMFCTRHPDQCELPFTQANMTTIQDMKDNVDLKLIPTPEKVDHWDIVAEGPADCEDYALTLRAHLRKRFPRHMGAFRILTAYTEQQQYHVVLAIETNAGKWVCDNRYTYCQSSNRFPYKWRLEEIPGGKLWAQLGPWREVKSS